MSIPHIKAFDFKELEAELPNNATQEEKNAWISNSVQQAIQLSKAYFQEPNIVNIVPALNQLEHALKIKNLTHKKQELLAQLAEELAHKVLEEIKKLQKENNNQEAQTNITPNDPAELPKETSKQEQGKPLSGIFFYLSRQQNEYIEHILALFYIYQKTFKTRFSITNKPRYENITLPNKAYYVDCNAELYETKEKLDNYNDFLKKHIILLLSYLKDLPPPSISPLQDLITSVQNIPDTPDIPQPTNSQDHKSPDIAKNTTPYFSNRNPPHHLRDLDLTPSPFSYMEKAQKNFIEFLTKTTLYYQQDWKNFNKYLKNCAETRKKKALNIIQKDIKFLKQWALICAQQNSLSLDDERKLTYLAKQVIEELKQTDSNDVVDIQAQLESYKNIRSFQKKNFTNIDAIRNKKIMIVSSIIVGLISIVAIAAHISNKKHQQYKTLKI